VRPLIAVRAVMIIVVILAAAPLMIASSAYSRSLAGLPVVPVGRQGEIGPPRVTSAAQSPSPVVARYSGVPSPFIPRDPVAFQEAKLAANAGHLSSRALVRTNSLAPGIADAEFSFPVMSYEGQVAAFGLDQETLPPDTQLAAGPSYLLEVVNRSGSIWTKGGQLVSDFDLGSFFQVPAPYSFGDPRVLFDSASERWFVSGFAFDHYNDSQVYIAVSATANPTGAWSFYTVASNTSGILYDQPKIGLSDDKVAISWNSFGTFSGSETMILQKADMLAGSDVAFKSFGPDTSRFDVVPAQSLSSSSTEYLVYNNSDRSNLGDPTLGVVAISGTPGNGDVTWNESDPPILATSVPPNAVQPSGPAIVTNDDRLLSAVWQNGILWTSGNDMCVPAADTTDRSCLRLIQVSTASASPTILQDFDVGWTDGYLFYPAVTLDGNGDAAFSFSMASSSTWASAAMADQYSDEPASSVQGPFPVQPGLGSFAFNCLPNYSINRWGDYSAAAPDPGNPSDVWVTGEYAASSTDRCDWGTATAEVTLGQPWTRVFLPSVYGNDSPKSR